MVFLSDKVGAGLVIAGVLGLMFAPSTKAFLFLSILCWERLVYGAAYHVTPIFRQWLKGLPTRAFGSEQRAMHAIVGFFKIVQLSVFFAMDVPELLEHHRRPGDETCSTANYSCRIDRLAADDVIFASATKAHTFVGLATILLGLLLNFSTYWALGFHGTHYGAQLGRKQAWINSFPFNVVPHPQYLGVIIFLWGIYLGLAPDWQVFGSSWSVAPFCITLLYGLSCSVLENGEPLLSRRSWSVTNEDQAEAWRTRVKHRQDKTQKKTIVFVTDAWFPQVNGVVRTVSTVAEEMRKLEYDVKMVVPDPEVFYTVPLPLYNEIPLCINAWKAFELLGRARPDGVQIFTEGPLGLAARFYCIAHGIPFTTTLCTRFPEYINLRVPLFPVKLGYRILRWFHAPAQAVLVANQELRDELADQRGFSNTRLWTRGVDLDQFHPSHRDEKLFAGLSRPIMLYVGRVAEEKNIEAMLELRQAGTKVVVGDGPAREDLQKRYPDALFLGKKYKKELARHYASADIVVFPSLTDTFGLVVIEGMASGVPVAAFPVTGPMQTIEETSGACEEDLNVAVAKCLRIKGPEGPRLRAEGFSWTRCAKMLEEHMHLGGGSIAA